MLFSFEFVSASLQVYDCKSAWLLAGECIVAQQLNQQLIHVSFVLCKIDDSIGYYTAVCSNNSCMESIKVKLLCASIISFSSE